MSRNARLNHYRGKIMLALQDLRDEVARLPQDDQYTVAADVLGTLDKHQRLPPQIHKAAGPHLLIPNIEIALIRMVPHNEKGADVLMYELSETHSFYPGEGYHLPGRFLDHPYQTENELLAVIRDKYQMPEHLFRSCSWPKFVDRFHNIAARPGPVLHQVFQLLIPRDAEIEFPAGRWVRVVPVIDSDHMYRGLRFPEGVRCLSFHSTLISIAISNLPIEWDAVV